MKVKFATEYDAIPLSINNTYTAATEGWDGQEVHFKEDDKEMALRKIIAGYIIKMNNKFVFFNTVDFKETFEVIKEE